MRFAHSTISTKPSGTSEWSSWKRRSLGEETPQVLREGAGGARGPRPKCPPPAEGRPRPGSRLSDPTFTATDRHPIHRQARFIETQRSRDNVGKRLIGRCTEHTVDGNNPRRPRCPPQPKCWPPRVPLSPRYTPTRHPLFGTLRWSGPTPAEEHPRPRRRLSSAAVDGKKPQNVRESRDFEAEAKNLGVPAR